MPLILVQRNCDSTYRLVAGCVFPSSIRKADGAWGEAARHDGLADTRFCNLDNFPITATFANAVAEYIVPKCLSLAGPGLWADQKN